MTNVPRLSVVAPAERPESSVGEVLEDAKKYEFDSIVIVGRKNGGPIVISDSKTPGEAIILLKHGEHHLVFAGLADHNEMSASRFRAKLHAATKDMAGFNERFGLFEVSAEAVNAIAAHPKGVEIAIRMSNMTDAQIAEFSALSPAMQVRRISALETP